MISSLRNSMGDPEVVDQVITKDDFTMAASLVQYSVATSFNTANSQWQFVLELVRPTKLKFPKMD